ncbi:YncE family protein [Glacieibacterium frigidum]|nr:YncE family protein [Glacieibacterium frigidum]
MLAGLALAGVAQAAQAPFPAAAPDTPISSRDRVYAAEQFSNTVSVTDPSTNRLLGVIRLGDPQPANFSPLYRGQVLVHGMGFAPDGRTIAVVSIGSNGVSFIDTATNAVKHTTYVGRSPHEAFYTPDGREVWVTVRGEDYIAVLDATTFAEVARVRTPNGPGMTIFSPDGRYAYVCSSFTPTLVVFDVASRAEAGRVAQPSPFCPNIAATPDGKQVWYTLKDIGKTVVIDAAPPFATLATLDTGPITNHVNFVDTARGRFAYVTVGGLNEVQVFDRWRFTKVVTIPVGSLPHGIWPSGDGTRVYVGLEGGDELVAIDTRTNNVVARVPIGQGAQALNYVPGAVPVGDGTAGLQPLGLAGNAFHLAMGPPGQDGAAPTTVALYDQGLVQVLEAAVTELAPRANYVLGFRDAAGAFEPLASFTTNPAGAAIVNATGQIRQIVRDGGTTRRWLEIVVQGSDSPAQAVQVQRP